MNSKKNGIHAMLGLLSLLILGATLILIFIMLGINKKEAPKRLFPFEVNIIPLITEKGVDTLYCDAYGKVIQPN